MRTTIENVTKEMIKNEVKDYELMYTRTGDKKYNTLNVAVIPCGFDIESYKQFMYIWTFTICDLTVIGYTWEDFKHLLSILKETFDLGKKIKTTKHRNGTISENAKAPVVLPIFIHNIKYEWAFMKTQIIYAEPFYFDKANRNPMYVVGDDAFLFIDSYKIYPMSLEDVSKAYTKTKKAVGDLDYNKPRNIEDAKHLTEKELNYCVCDTKILSELASYTFDTYFKPYGKLPFTQNQLVKSVIKDTYKTVIDSMSDKERNELTKHLHRITLSQDDYRFIREKGFRGGYCASSETETSNEQVGYADLTSAYCGAILHDYFPMGEYITPSLKVDSENTIDYYAEKFCCQMRLKFYNLRSSGDKLVKYESYSNVTPYNADGSDPATKEESREASKAVLVNSSNKVWKAPCIVVSITEIDWEIYKKVYVWDKLEVLDFKTSVRGELPDYVKLTAIKLYGNKAKIKKTGNTKSPEYISAKTLVSNIFGAMVQKIDDEIVNGSETEWYAKQRDSILKSQWGVYVAAHTRRKLINMILALGKECWLYSDTDSIYYILNAHSKKIFKDYNNKIKLKNTIMCQKYNLDFKIYDDLGCWDDESNKDLKIWRFKTLGSKAYLYYYTDKTHPHGDWKFVLSGISEEVFWEAYAKANPLCVIKDKDKEIDKVFKFFEKTTKVTYVRNTIEFTDSSDMEINGMMCHSDSGAIIIPHEIHGSLGVISEANALLALADEVDDTRV